ncbi:MAG TPA: protein-L-isoaspartate(D-aspartate) O-methyltransferase [Chloroflexi bacterium]|nr:MAG: protein-L-isoaspartate O-methyltransferase [Anaerolineaceae bacterium 4572_5.2]HEY83627.1 protein-L-isoaspartate(D-aspartate) O-methyltransferase [Chloroflexota bacterium]
MDNFTKARHTMVNKQLKQRGIVDPLVLEAMGSVPRHSFVSMEYQELAYKDSPLPIGYGQTISQPYIVAFMLQELRLKTPRKAIVLEIGSGLGYQAAVLSQFVKHVYTVERIPELAAQAEQNLLALSYSNITVCRGDGGYGWPKYAPYDAIVVAAAAPEIPPPLLSQLKADAALVIPVGEAGNQQLIRAVAKGRKFHTEVLAPVAFVPLIGEHGWPESKDEG